MIRPLLDDDCLRLCEPGNYPGYVLGCMDWGGTGYTVLTGVYDGTSIGHPERNGYRVLVQKADPFVPWPPLGTGVPVYFDLALPQPAPIGGVYEHLVTKSSEYEDNRVFYAPYRAHTDPSVPNALTCLLRWQNTRGGFGDPDGDWDTPAFVTLSSQYFWGTGNFAEGDQNGFLRSHVSYGYFDPTLAGDAVRAVWFDADSFGTPAPPADLQHLVSSWTLATPVYSNHTVIGCTTPAGDGLTGIWACGTRQAFHHALDPDRTAAWAGCIFTPGFGGLPGNHLLDLDEAPGIYASALNYCWFNRGGSLFAVGWKQAIEDGDKAPLLMHYTPAGGWDDISSILPAWPFVPSAPRSLDLVGITQAGFAATTDPSDLLITGWMAVPDCAGAARQPLAWVLREEADLSIDRVFWAGLQHGTYQLPYTDTALLCMGQDVSIGATTIMAAGASCGQWATFRSAGIGLTYGDADGWFAGYVQV